MTFESTASKILEESHVNVMRTPQKACMKDLMTVDEVKDVCGEVAFDAPFSLTFPLVIQREAKQVFNFNSLHICIISSVVYSFFISTLYFKN